MNPNETFTAEQSDSTPASNPGANNPPEGRMGTTTEKIRRTAGQAADRAKQKVAQVADEQKDAAADKIGGYGSRLRDTARSAEAEDPNIAHFANEAADRLESVANYVRDADITRLKEDAVVAARRHPALFMGGMLVAGLVIGNLVKASVQSLNENETDDGEDIQDHYPDGHDFPEQSDGQTNYAAESVRGTGGPEFPVASAAFGSAAP